MSDTPALICSQCQIGHFHTESRPYVRVVDGMLLSVPNMPALICDVCGYQDFDREGLTRVEALLGHVGSHARTGRSMTKVTLQEAKPSQRLKP